MSLTDPQATTPEELCLEALRECGAFGMGQTPLADDVQRAKVRLQWMVQQWQRKRWLVPTLLTQSVATSGARVYTVGPKGDFGGDAFSQRPAKIDSALYRLADIDYPLLMLWSREDFNRRIYQKSAGGWPVCGLYEPKFPLGEFAPWPIPPAGGALILSFASPLPANFVDANALFTLPFEYYNAMLLNLAVALRSSFRVPTFPGDPLVVLAKQALDTIRGANFALPTLKMPHLLSRRGTLLGGSGPPAAPAAAAAQTGDFSSDDFGQDFSIGTPST